MDLNEELLDAVMGNHTVLVQWLLTQGADPNYAEDEALIRPLHFAALYNSAEVIPFLLLAGADIYARTECDETPLSIAKRHNHDAVVQTLERFQGMYVMCSIKQ